jgi:hypothetical protein
MRLGGQTVLIAPPHPHEATATAPPFPHYGLEHIGLTVDDVDTAVAELRAKGAEIAIGRCQVNLSRSEKPEAGRPDHTAATAFRHSLAASVRKIRSVDRETRWR